MPVGLVDICGTLDVDRKGAGTALGEAVWGVSVGGKGARSGLG